MNVRVECCAGHRGEATPRRLFLDPRQVELVELLDCWLAPDHRYFKLRGADGATYILRHDESRGHWELTLQRCERGRDVTSDGKARLRAQARQRATAVRISWSV